MTRILNSEEEKSKLKLATEQECVDRRKALIFGGIIKPARKSEIMFRKNSVSVVSTKRTRKLERIELIKEGIIDPNYCKVIIGPKYKSNTEEGEYKTKPIKSNDEYEQRKSAYFRILQEVLKSRKELNLNLGPKKDSDPDWVF